jgi:hypothetical protein
MGSGGGRTLRTAFVIRYRHSVHWQVPTMWDFTFSRQQVWSLRVFWYVALCSLIVIDWCFRVAYCLHHQGDDSSCWWWRQYARASGTLVYSETTRCYILEDSKLPTHEHEGLWSYKWKMLQRVEFDFFHFKKESGDILCQNKLFPFKKVWQSQ